MKKLIPLLLVVLSFFGSCTQTESADQFPSAMVNSDSLIALWNTAWNSNDSAAIANLMTQDVDLISSGKITKGLNRVAAVFIGPNAKVIKNLKTESISSGSSENQAYYFGTYSHDVLMSDSLRKGITGTFSFIYVKEGDRWLIKVAEIE